jgi:hypothetical protein
MSARDPKGSDGQNTDPEQRKGDPRGDGLSRRRQRQQSADQRRQELADELGIEQENVRLSSRQSGVELGLTSRGEQRAEQNAAQRVAEQAAFIERDDVRANVDPETFAVDRQLTGEGTTEAEQRLAQQTAADQEFVRPGDLQADVDPETFTAEASLTEEGRQNAQQRQAEQLRQQAASQSDRFGESDFRVDRSGEEVSVEPTEEAVDRERREQAAQQFESQSQFIGNVEPQDVNLSGDGAQLDDSIIEQAEQRAQRQARQQASQQRQQARREFAQSIESGSAFSDLPDGVDPASLVDNIDPQQDIVREGDSLALADDVQGRINSQLESDAVQQQRQEFAQALESGEAFESGEAPDALGSVDPQTDVAVEDGQLTLADDTQAELIESQIRAQAGATPGLNTDDVVERAASQDEILEAVEEEIESQTGTDVRPGLIEDANLSVSPDGTISANRLLLNSRRFDDFRDVSTIRAQSDVLDGAELSIDATEVFSGRVEESIAEQISERNVVDVSPDQIDISGGNVSTQTPESLTIENDQITADGLTESGQDDFARRQLQSIETTEGISVATPIDSQPFANVSARLAEAAEGGGSLSSATRIVAASETVDNIGDLDNMADTRIIAGLEPDQAEERLGIDADTVREAQRDIQVNQIELNNDPEAVLEDIASNQDEFVEDSTRIGVAGERGQRIRQSARSQLSELEADIAAGDDSVSPGDVNLSLTDDLSGIRSVNQAGRQAIAEQVDSQLANFDSSEINVGVSGGEITTSIEDSVRDRFIQNAQRVEEIQVRNEIADSTEGIGRRDIEVDAGEGVSPSDELVTETLGTDVNADIESFDQLQQAAETQARFQARQQAIEQAESQTIGAVDPRDVSVERTTDGFEVEFEGTAERQTLSDISDGATSVDTRVENRSPQVTDPIRAVESGLRNVGAGIDERLGSGGRAVGSTLADVNIGVQAAQQATNSDIGDRFFEEAGAGGARALNPALIAAEGVQAADILARGPDREFGFEDLPGAGDAAALQAGAEGDLNADVPQTSEDFVVEAGEQDAAQLSRSFESDPVGTAGQLTGGAVVGTVTGTAITRGISGVRRGGGVDLQIDNRPDVGGAGRRVANAIRDADFGESRGQTSPLLGLEDRGSRSSGGLLDDLEDDLNNVESTSPEIDEGQTSVRPEFDRESDIEAGDFIERRTEVRRREVDDRSRDRAFERSLESEPTAPDVDVGTSQSLLSGAIGSAAGATTAITAADDSVQSPEVAFDDDLGDVETGGDVVERVDTAVVNGSDSQFQQAVGETGQQQFFERERTVVAGGSDIEAGIGTGTGVGNGVGVGVRPDDDVGAAPSEGLDVGVGVRPREDIGTTPRQDTPPATRQDTDVGTTALTATPISVDARQTPTPATPGFVVPRSPRPDQPDRPASPRRDEIVDSPESAFESDVLEFDVDTLGEISDDITEGL